MKHLGNRFARLSAWLVLLAGSVGTVLAAAPAPASIAAADADAAQLVKRAETDAALRQTLASEGRTSAGFCANCHGEGGISRYPEVPNLASQHPAYLLRQIEAFRSGKRKNDFMEGLMRLLKEREQAAIALHFASSPAKPSAAAPGPRAQQGAALFAKICARCHQDDARGTEQVPRLAGQQPEYLRSNLRRYLTQSGERIYAPMTAAVMQLGSDNIDAVVEYLTALR